jgi:hypothetical protein
MISQQILTYESNSIQLPRLPDGTAFRSCSVFLWE